VGRPNRSLDRAAPQPARAAVTRVSTAAVWRALTDRGGAICGEWGLATIRQYLGCTGGALERAVDDLVAEGKLARLPLGPRGEARVRLLARDPAVTELPALDVDRVLAHLEGLGESADAHQIAGSLDLPIASVRTHLTHLVQTGLVTRPARGLYRATLAQAKSEVFTLDQVDEHGGGS
jgi:hypothetical protein